MTFPPETYSHRLTRDEIVRATRVLLEHEPEDVPFEMVEAPKMAPFQKTEE